MKLNYYVITPLKLPGDLTIGDTHLKKVMLNEEQEKAI